MCEPSPPCRTDAPKRLSALIRVGRRMGLRVVILPEAERESGPGGSGPVRRRSVCARSPRAWRRRSASVGLPVRADPTTFRPGGPPGVANRCGQVAIGPGAVVRAEPPTGLLSRLPSSRGGPTYSAAFPGLPQASERSMMRILVNAEAGQGGTDTDQG